MYRPPVNILVWPRPWPPCPCCSAQLDVSRVTYSTMKRARSGMTYRHAMQSLEGASRVSDPADEARDESLPHLGDCEAHDRI